MMDSDSVGNSRLGHASAKGNSGRSADQALTRQDACRSWVVRWTLQTVKAAAGAFILGLCEKATEQAACAALKLLAVAWQQLWTFLYYPLSQCTPLHVPWAAECVMSVITLWSVRKARSRRFARSLAAYSATCFVYYMTLSFMGLDAFLNLPLRHILLTVMGVCMFDLASQNERLHPATVTFFRGSLVAVAIASLSGSAQWLTLATTILSVFTSALAGWAWRDKLSGTSVVFWCLFVATLAFRTRAVSAPEDWQLLYFTILNARWVTLSERCRGDNFVLGHTRFAFPAARVGLE